MRLIYIIFGFSSTCLSRRLLWRKITATHRSSANTRHSFTAQLLTASPQLMNLSTLPPSTLHPSLHHPSIPHPSIIPRHLHPPSVFLPSMNFFNPQKPLVQSPPVHNSTLSTPPYAPNPTTPPSLRPCSAIYDASAHPNCPEAITPDPPS